MKNNCKITVENLIEEIASVLRDEFVATFAEKEDSIFIKFLSGQKFSVSINEIL